MGPGGRGVRRPVRGADVVRAERRAPHATDVGAAVAHEETGGGPAEVEVGVEDGVTR